MKHISFVMTRYYEGEACCNRILAYIKGFVEHGWSVDLYYIISDKRRIKNSINLLNVSVIDLWEHDSWVAKKSKVVSYITNTIRLKRLLCKEDICFIYGSSFIQLFIIRYLLSYVHCYCEITEHPQIYSSYFKRIGQFFSLKLLRKISGVFVISKSLQDYFVRKGIPKNKICISNMFVDVNRFNGIVKSTNEKYITYCGSISNKKDGVDILIRAFSKFHKRIPEYKLMIIGKAVNEDVLNNLINLVRSLNIIDFVIFTGHVHSNEMPQLLMNATILALARPNNLQAQNGFPTKLGEYLATGNPIVVTNVGEISDFIHDKENGILAKPDDVDDFAEKLLWVASNYEQAKQIAERGKELVDDKFSYYTQAKVVIDKIQKDLL